MKKMFASVDIIILVPFCFESFIRLNLKIYHIQWTQNPLYMRSCMGDN